MKAFIEYLCELGSANFREYIIIENISPTIKKRIFCVYQCGNRSNIQFIRYSTGEHAILNEEVPNICNTVILDFFIGDIGWRSRENIESLNMPQCFYQNILSLNPYHLTWRFL